MKTVRQLFAALVLTTFLFGQFPASAYAADAKCGSVWDYDYQDPYGGWHSWHTMDDPSGNPNMQNVVERTNRRNPDDWATTVAAHLDEQGAPLHCSC
jgi:hypothetical protein